MSTAWEVTEEDVFIVLEAHKIQVSNTRLSKIHDELDFDEIEKCVLSHNSFEEQCDASFDEIKRQLIESGVIN